MSSTDELSTTDQTVLLKVAHGAIEHGLRRGEKCLVNLLDYSERLRQPGASFVTLEIGGQLRGCIGTLTAYQPLIQDVAAHSYAAAFEDPRFPPLQQEEFSLLELHISVLSTPEPLLFNSEKELLEQLRPGVDGLILQVFDRRATFLPAVWDKLPEPTFFLNHLKLKAGLPLDFWSADIRAERYTTQSFGPGAADP